MASSVAILADTMSSHSIVMRGAEQSLAHRWSREIGGDLRPDEPHAMAPVVDRVVGTLPAPPRSMRVIDGDKVRDVGHAAPQQGAESNGPYARRLRGLVRDVRIFAACNFTVLLLTALLAGRRRDNSAPYLIPAALIAFSTVVATVGHLVAKDWFWSFLADDYGRGCYLALLVTIVLLLADILLNRARVVSVLLRILWWLPV